MHLYCNMEWRGFPLVGAFPTWWYCCTLLIWLMKFQVSSFRLLQIAKPSMAFCYCYLQAIPKSWGFMMEALDKEVMLSLTSENPDLDMLLPVSLVRWHPSARVCCRGSRTLCINLRIVPSAPPYQLLALEIENHI